MMRQLTSIVCRIIFLGSFLLAGIAILARLARFSGYLFLGIYDAWRVLEWSGIALLFVIALQLREIKISLSAKAPDK